MPQTLNSIEVPDEQVAEQSMPCGFDDDLIKQGTATSNRICGLLTQSHQAPERFIGPHLDQVAMAELLAKYPTPAALRRAGPGKPASVPCSASMRPGRGSTGPETSPLPWPPKP